MIIFKRCIEINKQIPRARGASELCTLIEASVADFNNVNVTTAFQALLQSKSYGGPHGVVERALQAIKETALRTDDAFETQQISTLHIMAKSSY